MTFPVRRSMTSTLRASSRQWLYLSRVPDGGPEWMRLVWSAVFSLAIALVFTLVGFAIAARTLDDWVDGRLWLVWFGRNLVTSLCIGYTIHALFSLVRATVGAERVLALTDWQRTAFFIAVPLLGTAIGWPIGIRIAFGDFHIVRGLTASGVASMLVVSLLISTLFYLYFSMRNREVRAAMRANEAQLRLLQGQMEPHFLFNTLATVVSLVDADAPRAKAMLESLTDYLRASLGSLRRDDSTLGAEIDLATRYLQLMRTRMGDRLAFEIDVAPALRSAAMPPLLLQPLVENAVKHGLEPQVDGGTVRIVAAAMTEAGRPALRLCIDDDGGGLEAAGLRVRVRVAGGPDGHGIALANLRERLASQFGTGASLTLAAREPGPGTRACLTLPLNTTQARPT